jgi:hypothetical protein
LLGSGNLLLRVAGCGRGGACEQKKNSRLREAWAREVPHGFHPLGWITPRKTKKSKAHDE